MSKVREAIDVVVSELPADGKKPLLPGMSNFEKKLGLALDIKDKKMVALLVALGEPMAAIAHKVGVELSLIEKFVKSEEGVDTIIQMQTGMCPDPVMRVKKIANLALDAQTRILLRSDNEGTIAKVAQDVLDRACGKAIQVTENRNLNVTVNDNGAADKQLAALQERLARLEQKKNQLVTSHKKKQSETAAA